MKTKLALFTALLAIIISSCGAENGGLESTSWRLVSYDGRVLLADTTMTAFFEDGQVNGSAGCNSYFGSYKSKGDQIEITGLGWTEMACMEPEGLMEQEQQVMSLFSQSATFSFQGEELHVRNESGGLMIFQNMENPD